MIKDKLKDKLEVIAILLVAPFAFILAYLVLLFGDVFYKSFIEFLKDMRNSYQREYIWFKKDLKSFPERMKQVWKGGQE